MDFMKYDFNRSLTNWVLFGQLNVFKQISTSNDFQKLPLNFTSPSGKTEFDMHQENVNCERRLRGRQVHTRPDDETVFSLTLTSRESSDSAATAELVES